jgi:AcrR family transcriptional regulator
MFANWTKHRERAFRQLEVAPNVEKISSTRRIATNLSAESSCWVRPKRTKIPALKPKNFQNSGLCCAVAGGRHSGYFLERRVMVGPVNNRDASPRNRIIMAAKHLMSAIGYENASTEAICNGADVTAAQLTKYFGTKEALLEAIFEDGWASLRMQLPLLQTAQSPRRRLKMLLHLLIRLFNQDSELRDLMLLEGRRIRRESRMVLLTPSYTELVTFVESLIKAELKNAAPHQVQLVRSGLIGLFEGLLRDKVLHDRFGFPAEFSLDEAEEYLSDAVDRLLSTAKP